VTNEANPCVYHNQGVMKTICAIFVDDGILCAFNEQEVHNILNHLQIVFEVIQRLIDYYVEFQITIDSLNHLIFINQSRYIKDIIKCFGWRMLILSLLLSIHIPYLVLKLDQKMRKSKSPTKKQLGT
jgi:hypothetical protein